MRLKLVATLLGIALSSSALAVNDTYGPVTDLWAEYMPTTVYFKVSPMPSACGSQNYFWFTSDNTDTTKAVFAMVMASSLSGKKVWIQYDPSNPCRAIMVHGLQ